MGRMVAMLFLGRKLQRTYRHQLDTSNNPEVVILNDRAKAIVDRAQALADAGREDAEAITELKELAGRHDHDLRVAVASFRQDGRDRESRLADRARRLLEAAASGEPIRPAGEDAEYRFRQLEEWHAVDQPARFRQLAAIEPRLARLEGEARSGRYGLPGPDPLHMSPDDPRHIGRELNHLLGPDGAHKDHPLLGTAFVASDTARYLWELTEPQR